MHSKGPVGLEHVHPEQHLQLTCFSAPFGTSSLLFKRATPRYLCHNSTAVVFPDKKEDQSYNTPGRIYWVGPLGPALLWSPLLLSPVSDQWRVKTKKEEMCVPCFFPPTGKMCSLWYLHMSAIGPCVSVEIVFAQSGINHRNCLYLPLPCVRGKQKEKTACSKSCCFTGAVKLFSVFHLLHCCLR